MSNLNRDKIIESLYTCGVTSPITIHHHLWNKNIKTNLRTVERKCKELKEYRFIAPPNYSKKGRKPILTEEDKTAIEEALEGNPTLNASELIETLNLSCSTRTVQRYLRKDGYNWKPIHDTIYLLMNKKMRGLSLHRSIFKKDGEILYL